MERKKTGRTPAKEGGIAVMEKPQVKAASVSEVAYSLYEKRGYAHGNDLRDWFEAEKIVNKGNK